MKNSLAVIIPAYNEQDTIKKVVKSVNFFGTPIVINDGSNDGTLKILKDLNIIYINSRFNKGYDKSIAIGIKKAIKLNFKYVIVIDADGQHNPDEINIFFNFLKKDYDIVLGVRPYKQRFSEKIFSFFFFFLYKISDPLCWFKAYKVSFLKTIKTINSYNSIGTEILLNGIKKKKLIKEVKIKLSKRNDKSRFGNFIVSNFRIINSLLKGLKFIIN